MQQVALAAMFVSVVSCFVVPPLHEVKPVSTTARELISINRDDLPGVMTDSIFDPLALSKGLSDRQVKRYREAELKHGRVGMLAATGLLVQEVFHPLFGGNFFGSPIYYFQEIQNIPPLSRSSPGSSFTGFSVWVGAGGLWMMMSSPATSASIPWG